MMIVVITDLDGTLLDDRSYSVEPAEAALAELKLRKVPLVLCTSKTRAETEVWRVRLRNQDPFVVENGGAVFIPASYFGSTSTTIRDGYEVVELGTTYSRLVEALRQCSIETDCPVRGFHDMSAAEIALDSGLSLEEAKLAKQREYDEPFLVRGKCRPEALFRAIANKGYRCVQGGRYHHIIGANDKASAVAQLLDRYRRKYDSVTSVGLGDGLNDAEFLNIVDFPVLIPSVHTGALCKRVPRGQVASTPGPAGWNDAVLAILTQLL